MDYSNIIITGEKIQQLADIYIGLDEDLNFNPLIRSQPNKHLNLYNINESYNNPRYIFCYTHRLSILSTKINLFMNDFILITHNSDTEIKYNSDIINILNCKKLLKWYCQNLCIDYNKLHLVPIGIANSQWNHGNIDIFLNISFEQKTKKIYFNFNIRTNINKRNQCYNLLKDKLIWLNNIHPVDNLKRLKEYEFCVCPEGNGCDTHRLWEAIYFKTVPIVINSEFTKILQKYNIPLVILESWNDLDIDKLNYNDYNFDNILISNFSYLANLIQN